MVRRLAQLVAVPFICLGATAVPLVGPAPGHADSGCPDALVPRHARYGDQVCVTPLIADEVAKENADPGNGREPNGGAYGPMTCKPGSVWREAFVGDTICVSPERRAESKSENASAPSAPPPNGGPARNQSPDSPSVGGPGSHKTPPDPPSGGGPARNQPQEPSAQDPDQSPAPQPGAPLTTSTVPPPTACDPRVDICVR
jgi:hypothetical protein